MLEGEGRALDIISWSMSEEGVKTLIKSISSKLAHKILDKSTERVGNIVGDVITNKPEEGVEKTSKRKQEYTDIINSLIQHRPTKEAVKKIGSKPVKRKQEYTDIINPLIQQQPTSTTTTTSKQ